MKLTKGIVSRERALEISPVYVAFVEKDFSKYNEVDRVFGQLKRGQKVLTYDHAQEVFVEAKVSSIKHDDIRAIDGPVVRVTNGECSWRVDGNGLAWPLET